jgi:hypothetical protein
MGVVEGVAVRLDDAPALGDPDPPAVPDALGTADVLGTAVAVGSGKSLLGTFAKASTKIRTKMTTTKRIQGFARLSSRGGSAPRYPGAGASSRAEPPRL